MLFGGAPIVPFYNPPKKEYYKGIEKKKRLNINLDRLSDDDSDISDFEHSEDSGGSVNDENNEDVTDNESVISEFDLAKHIATLLPDELIDGKPTNKEANRAHLEDLKYIPKPINYLWCFYYIYHRINNARIKERERRKHYIIKEYEKKVELYDINRKEWILKQIEQQEKDVKLEIYRSELRRIKNSKKKVDQRVHIERFTKDLIRRDQEARIMNYYADNLTKWAIEGINNQEIYKEEQDQLQKTLKEQNKLKMKERKRLKLIADDANIVMEDEKLTKEIETMMIRYGMIEYEMDSTLTEEQKVNGIFFNNKAFKQQQQLLTQHENENERIKLTAGDNHSRTFLKLTMKYGLDLVFMRKKLKKSIHKRKKDDSVTFPFKQDLSGTGEITYLKAENIQEAGALFLAAELTRGACPILETLNIKDCRVRSYGLGRIFQGIKQANLLSLRCLNLSGNFIQSEGIEYMREICSSGVFMNLQVLNLSRNELGDAGLGTLVQIVLSGYFLNILEIDLQYNSITDLGFKKLVDVLKSLQITKCPLLQRLHLENNLISSRARRKNAPYPIYFSL